MKPIVYIERPVGEPMWEHCLSAWQGFKWDGYEVRFFLPLTDNSFLAGPRASVWAPDDVIPPLQAQVPVVGSVESTQRLFVKKTIPKPLNVPEELLPHAGRTIERLRLGDAIVRMESNKHPMFIKPADTCKLFTGGVISSPAHVAFLFAGIDTDTPVLISPEIDFVTEYRLFINRDREISSMRHYSGDPFITPSLSVVKTMIAAYTKAPRCYALDVGVTSSGKTVVVECNDFWSLGTYGMDPVAYSRMLAQRWHEMITDLT